MADDGPVTLSNDDPVLLLDDGPTAALLHPLPAQAAEFLDPHVAAGAEPRPKATAAVDLDALTVLTAFPLLELALLLPQLLPLFDPLLPLLQAVLRREVQLPLLAVSLALLREVLLSPLLAAQWFQPAVLLPKLPLAIPLRQLPFTLGSPQVLPILKLLLLLQTLGSAPLIEPLTVQALGWEGSILTSRGSIEGLRRRLTVPAIGLLAVQPLGGKRGRSGLKGRRSSRWSPWSPRCGLPIEATGLLQRTLPIQSLPRLLAFGANLAAPLVPWAGAYIDGRSIRPATRGYDRRLRQRGPWSGRCRCDPLRIVLSALKLLLLAALKAFLLTFQLPIQTLRLAGLRWSLWNGGALLRLRRPLAVQALQWLWS